MKFKVIIDRIEGEMAVLRHGTKDIVLPIVLFGEDVKEGSAWYLSLSQDFVQAEKNEQLAKDILNEILNSDDVS